MVDRCAELCRRLLKDGRHRDRFFTPCIPSILPGSGFPLDVDGTVAVTEHDDLPLLLFSAYRFVRSLFVCAFFVRTFPMTGANLHGQPFASQVLFQCAIRASHFPANLAFRISILRHGAYQCPLVIQFVRPVASTRLASQLLSHGLAACEGLLGALGDKRAFYLRGQREGEGYYVALQVVAQLEVFLDRDHVDLLVHQ